MEKHLSLLASLQIGLSIFGLIIAAIVVGTDIISQDDEAFLILSTIGSIIVIFLVITCVPGIIGGIGLFKRKNWARILVLIFSAIDLLDIPTGTALAIYSFWVLLQDETIKLFSDDTTKTVVLERRNNKGA